MAEPLSPARRLLYALGNPGFQVTDRIIVLVAVYFYLPPPGRGLEAQVPESTYLGFVTVFGVAMLVGRVFDTLADPVIGHFSDRSTSRFGRRRVSRVTRTLGGCYLPLSCSGPAQAGNLLRVSRMPPGR